MLPRTSGVLLALATMGALGRRRLPDCLPEYSAEFNRALDTAGFVLKDEAGGTFEVSVQEGQIADALTPTVNPSGMPDISSTEQWPGNVAFR